MQLIDVLDSPRVRRIAMSLRLLGLQLKLRSVALLHRFGQFQQSNPVVKAASFG